MRTAQKILDIARAELGNCENPPNSNKTKYGVAYGWNGVPWCAIFVWWCFRQAGMETLLPTKTASCGVLMQAAKSSSLWVTKDFKPGDILIYDFPGGASTDHTGICESADGNNVVAIEGNTSTGNQANGGQVMRRRRPAGYVRGAVRPKYDIEKPLPLIAQEVLDGKWGNGDERKKRLVAEGNDVPEVQKLVNALCKGGIRCQVTASTVLNIREKPDAGSKKIDVFGGGVIVTLEEVREGPGASCWGRVGNGWISCDWVKVIS